ncbi:MAG: extracellular solute-binding protein [Lachnospiraceae bacterium]|nr:extracellular solute-binding protein [Lachnospiraceae bacterium]
MRRLKRWLSVAMAGTMLAGCLTGCAGGGSGAKGEPITLTVFSQLANYSGEQTGWSADVLLEKFNVKLNIVPDLNGAYQTRMEAGDLGDIVVWGSDGSSYTNAIKAGLLYDWNEDDLLADYGPYILENMGNALEHNATIKPEGMEGDTVYGFGHAVAASSEDHQAFFYTWDLRWDLYKELGYPEVKEIEDLIPVFEDMKELCPTDENGNPTYATALWPDWDGDMCMYVKSTATAFYGYDELGIGLYDPATGNYYDCLMEDGPYLRMLHFYNQLYQKGLLDPDSMTNTYDKMTEKVQAGGTFFSIFNYSGRSIFNTDEHMANGQMMLSLTPDNASPIVYGMDTLGSNRIWSIGAKTQYPELCMEIINYLCTPEGRLTMEYGPQGVTWDYDENGLTYFTELGKLCHADITTSMEDAGYTGTFHDGQLQINNITWALDATNPESGERFNCDYWASNNVGAGCDIEQDWMDYTGCTTTDEYMESKAYTVAPASAFVGGSRDDELETKWDQTTNCIVTYSWNAIYAESDEEYEQIVDEMIEKANSYYYEECLEWSREEAARRKACEDAIK